MLLWNKNISRCIAFLNAIKIVEIAKWVWLASGWPDVLALHMLMLFYIDLVPIFKRYLNTRLVKVWYSDPHSNCISDIQSSQSHDEKHCISRFDEIWTLRHFQSYHLKYRKIWNMDFLKIRFQMVQFSKGRAINAPRMQADDMT